MSERRFRPNGGELWALGLLLVWCLKYRRRILGGRVASLRIELLEQVPRVHGWESASVGYVSESTVRRYRYVGHQWDAVAS
ncbi:MAG: REP-associated tyrosine transposase [Mycobacterium sp.]|jgi:REP element-mobilizing transposase RayT|nr:REP-associated tyrosine transposase [Mycobacterium sp.]